MSEKATVESLQAELAELRETLCVIAKMTKRLGSKDSSIGLTNQGRKLDAFLRRCPTRPAASDDAEASVPVE